MFGLRILVAFLIPDVPGPVRLAIEREQYLQKQAFEGAMDAHEDFTLTDDDVKDAVRQLLGSSKKKA